eukprot:TRINITY_DN28446_c0_g1_i1.p1 TRINITY_DN28446_c0_g1~~TRINITY_DN28446_c0_g1_i1.p1  ORF type:complete len:195 (-),score=34.07 TRINITY_DN28446_c0_g1_i1:34-576(-)
MCIRDRNIKLMSVERMQEKQTEVFKLETQRLSAQKQDLKKCEEIIAAEWESLAKEIVQVDELLVSKFEVQDKRIEEERERLYQFRIRVYDELTALNQNKQREWEKYSQELLEERHLLEKEKVQVEELNYKLQQELALVNATRNKLQQDLKQRSSSPSPLRASDQYRVCLLYTSPSPRDQA